MTAGQPGQQILESFLEADELSEETYEKYIKTLNHNNGFEGIDAALRENELDVLIGPPTGRGTSPAIIAGYPVGTLPLGYARFNGRAFGLTVMAPANAEPLILRVMSAWDEIIFKRQPPSMLVENEAAVAETSPVEGETLLEHGSEVEESVEEKSTRQKKTNKAPESSEDENIPVAEEPSVEGEHSDTW